MCATSARRSGRRGSRPTTRCARVDLPQTLAAAALLAAICCAAAAGWRRRPWLAHWLGLVPRLAGADDRDRPGRRPVDGRPLCVRPSPRAVHCARLGAGRGSGQFRGGSAWRRRRGLAAPVRPRRRDLGPVRGHWKDDVTLFTHAALVTSDNAFAHFNLGGELLARGDQRAAREHLLEAVRLAPGSAEARVTSASSWSMTPRSPRGSSSSAWPCASSRRRRPGSTSARPCASRPAGGGRAGVPGGAAAEPRAADRADEPRQPALGSGRFEEAYSHYREARRLAPGDAGSRSTSG